MMAFSICFSLSFIDLSGYKKQKPLPQGDISLLSRACGPTSAPLRPEGCSWASLPAPPVGPSDLASFNKPFNISYKRCLACLSRRIDKSGVLEVGE